MKKKNQVFQNFITPIFFWTKDGGVVGFFFFPASEAPQKTSEALKKDSNFGFLTLKYNFKK